jgi:hypothetical protein
MPRHKAHPYFSSLVDIAPSTAGYVLQTNALVQTCWVDQQDKTNGNSTRCCAGNIMISHSVELQPSALQVFGVTETHRPQETLHLVERNNVIAARKSRHYHR